MRMPEFVSNLAVFIEEAYAKSSLTRYRNLKTRIDIRNTDPTLMQYSLLCNTKAFDILNEEYTKLKFASFEYNETNDNIQIKANNKCYMLSKQLDTCNCLILSNFALPFRTIPNIWRKELEHADGSEDIYAVQSSTAVNKRKKL